MLRMKSWKLYILINAAVAADADHTRKREVAVPTTVVADAAVAIK